MKVLAAFVILFAVSCMKSKEEYRQAIDDIQKEESLERQEEEAEVPPERIRGSDDKEGMGMYE